MNLYGFRRVFGPRQREAVAVCRRMVPVEGRQRPEEYLNSLPETTRMPARSAGIHIALLAGYLVLATIHTYPLILHLDTHLAGQGLGDNVSFVWNVWWMREALASSSYDFFTNPLIEAPLGASLILHTHTALSAFLGATVLAPLSVVAAQNILLIVSLALNGMSAYLLSLVVTRARGPSILAWARCFCHAADPPPHGAPQPRARVAAGIAAPRMWWWRKPVWTAWFSPPRRRWFMRNYYYAVFFGFAIAYAVVGSGTCGSTLRADGDRPAHTFARWPRPRRSAASRSRSRRQRPRWIGDRERERAHQRLDRRGCSGWRPRSSAGGAVRMLRRQSPRPD
jgi:hypothetical protein